MIPVEIRPALAEDLPAILAWRSTTTLAPYRPQCIRCRPARSPSGKRGLDAGHWSTVDAAALTKLLAEFPSAGDIR